MNLHSGRLVRPPRWSYLVLVPLLALLMGARQVPLVVRNLQLSAP